MPISYILTCEHAGNEIPEEYEHLFRGKKEVLYSHKAIDFGALRLARHLAAEANLPLYYTTTSRLVVETNRSLDNEDLFSTFTKNIPDEDKQYLLQKYYFPHRKQVEEKIAAEIATGNQVMHMAIHTFTPILEGDVREADIGILFNPEHPLEQAFAQRLKEHLFRQNPDRQVLYNSPYTGIADGFPTYLRIKFSQKQYAGFELEINQKFFLNGEEAIWQTVMTEITAGLKAMIQADDLT